MNDEQESQLAAYFESVREENLDYFIFFRNCMQVVSRGLKEIGITTDAYLLPEELFFDLLSKYPQTPKTHTRQESK